MFSKGYQVSDIADMKISGKNLKIFFVSDETGNIVKIISLK